MHPGNILVDAKDPEDPTFIVLDFGIVGILPPEHLYYLGENFLALFDQDYYRIAKLHVDAGWLPADTRLDDLEGAVRAVCEPHFSRPLSEISLGAVLVQLLGVARQFQLTVQPELVLLQKTLLNIEGMGRSLDPDIDIWAVASPILTDIIRRRYGLESVAKDIRPKLPALLSKLPEMPTLLHGYLRDAESDRTQRAEHRRRSERLIASGYRRVSQAILAFGALIGAIWTSGSPVTPPLDWPWYSAALGLTAGLLGYLSLRGDRGA